MKNLLATLAALTAILCHGAPVAQPRLVTVDADNHISPSNVLATAVDAARIEAQVVANEAAVTAQEKKKNKKGGRGECLKKTMAPERTTT